jgi:hypothetical protein
VQLPNQLQGRSVKGQVRALGPAEVAKRAPTVFDGGMTFCELAKRYREPLGSSAWPRASPARSSIRHARRSGSRRRTSRNAART